MRLPRDLLVRAFPDNPRLVTAFEEIDRATDDASTAADALETATNAADALKAVAAVLSRKIDASDNLKALSALPVAVGAVEMVGPNLFDTRPINGQDDGSLVTRNRVFQAPPATSSSTGLSPGIAMDASYLYVCVAANSWKRIALTAF